MAKRIVNPAAQRSRAGGETSTVLVFFLVFSILLNLGLGVATYFGFQHDSAIKNKLDESEKQVKYNSGQAEWYKFLALSYRQYMGRLPAGQDQEDLNLLRDKFDHKQIGNTTPAIADKEAVTTFINDLETTRKLSRNPAAPLGNYEAIVADLQKNNETLTAQNNQLRADKAKAEERKKNAEDELAKEIQKNKDELAKLQKDANAKLDEYFKNVEAARNDQVKQDTEAKAAITAIDGEKRKVEQQLAIKNVTIDQLKKTNDKKDIQITRLEKDLGHDAPGGAIKMDWRIVNIDKNGTTAYINLGSADKVKSGLTFRVHGIGEDGKPQPRDKATVEVLKSVDDHLAQVRVLYDYDERLEPRPQRHNPRQNPVLKGDVVYNPTWDPNEKKHIAIAGAIDLVGDGRNSLPEFIRGLERQNVVVDAYLDTNDMEIKGPGITVNTDLLIIAPLPQVLLDARGADVALKSKAQDAVARMKKDADENGVKRRGLKRYLEEIGYRVPKNLSDEGSDYVKSKETQAPTPKPDAPKPPDVPQPPDAPKPPDAPPKMP